MSTSRPNHRRTKEPADLIITKAFQDAGVQLRLESEASSLKHLYTRWRINGMPKASAARLLHNRYIHIHMKNLAPQKKFITKN